MSRGLVLVSIAIGCVCCALADKSESTELVKKRSEEKLSSPPNGNHSAFGGEKSSDKQARTVNHRLEFEDDCCDSRRGSNPSRRPETNYEGIGSYGSRYPTKFGERPPIDRYGWQTQGQPGSSSGSGGPSGSGSYPAFYEGSHAGYRPSHAAESSHKPNGYDSGVFGGYGYGGQGGGYSSFARPTEHGRPTPGSGYGISGVLDNGDVFGQAGPAFPEETAPSHPNIQAQKAVALKALAGVALLGAAAALAANPVLLPLGFVSGRRKRSHSSIGENDALLDLIETILKDNSTKNYDNESGRKTSMSSACIARLVCEIRKSQLSNEKKDGDYFKESLALQRRLSNLTLNNASMEELENTMLKKLMKAARTVSSNGGNCDKFVCTMANFKDTKDPSIFKL